MAFATHLTLNSICAAWLAACDTIDFDQTSVAIAVVFPAVATVTFVANRMIRINQLLSWSFAMSAGEE